MKPTSDISILLAPAHISSRGLWAPSAGRTYVRRKRKLRSTRRHTHIYISREPSQYFEAMGFEPAVPSPRPPHNGQKRARQRHQPPTQNPSACATLSSFMDGGGRLTGIKSTVDNGSVKYDALLVQLATRARAQDNSPRRSASNFRPLPLPPPKFRRCACEVHCQPPFQALHRSSMQTLAPGPPVATNSTNLPRTPAWDLPIKNSYHHNTC